MMQPENYKNKLPEKMLTVQEVASILNIHPNTARRWERKGLLKSHRIGPNYNLRFKQEDILDFLDKSRSGAHTAHE